MRVIVFHSLFNEKLPKQVRDPSVTHLCFNAFSLSDSLICVTMTTKCIKNARSTQRCTEPNIHGTPCFYLIPVAQA